MLYFRAVKVPEVRLYTHRYQSPIGELFLAVDRQGRVIRLGFEDQRRFLSQYSLEENKYACGEVEYQLDDYFAGRLQRFSLEFAFQGTEFQRSVWSRLVKVPYGTTTTYGEIAQKVGKRGAARAVGNAVAANPVALIVPCHRVLPASGAVGNYAVASLNGRGSTAKEWLLHLEGALTTDQPELSLIA